MKEESYNVVWQDYPDHLREMLHNMMNNTDFADVTLVCDDGKEVQSHKAVLSACSPVFKKMLSNRMSFLHPIVFLKDINHEDLEFILQFAYLGETSFHQSKLKNFLDTASSLQIKELSKDKLGDEIVIRDDEFLLQNDTIKKHKNRTVDKFSKKQIQTLYADDQKQGTVTVKEEIMNNLENCPICKSEFSNKNDLKDHYKSSHKVKKAGDKVGNDYYCSSCPYITQQANDLAQHFQSNHQEIMFKCSSCEFKVKDKSILKDHIKNYHEELVGKINCSICDYKAANKSELANHKNNEHQVKAANKQYACFMCQFKAPEKENLKHHISTEHTEDLEKLGSPAS